VFRDTVEPFRYLTVSGNELLLFAADAANIPYIFPRVTLAALECNHDAELLAERCETWQMRAEKKCVDIARPRFPRPARSAAAVSARWTFLKKRSGVQMKRKGEISCDK
jgi:hypothetical protein